MIVGERCDADVRGLELFIAIGLVRRSVVAGIQAISRGLSPSVAVARLSAACP